MADGPTGPDFGAMLALINASKAQGGTGAAPILMGLQLDVNIGSGLSMQGKGFNSDAMVIKAPQRRNGPIAGLLKQMGLEGAQIAADIGKCAQNAGVIYQGPVTTGAPVVSNAPVASGDGPQIG